MKLNADVIVKLEKINIHKCDVCSNVYLSHNELEKHLARHDPDNIDITNEEVLKHIKSAHVLLDRRRAFSCEVCQDAFPTFSEYSLHKLQHIQQDVIKSRVTKKDHNANSKFIKTFKCTKCELSFVAASTLSAHSVVHDPYPNICECGIGFYAKADLKSHRKLVHPVCYKTEDESDIIKEETEPRNKGNQKTDKLKKDRKKRGIKPKNKAKPLNEIKKKSVVKKEENQMPIEMDENNKYVCPICKKLFKSKINTIVHLRVHTGERPFECDLCEKRFSQSGALKLHMERHTGIRRFNCQYCAKKFHAYSDVVLHERTHTKEKPFKCTYCIKAFSDPSAFNRHTRTHTGYKPYQCPYCPMKFSDASGLTSHKMRHENKKQIQCKVCKKKFYNKHSLRCHSVVHTKTKNFECQDCSKTFALKQYLTVHRDLVHIGTRRFECDYCQKMFKSKAYLKSHYATVHEAEKIEVICNECGKKFKNKFTLITHIANIHSGTEKEFECDHCGTLFRSKQSVRKHIIRRHLKIRCDKCSKPFATTSLLLEHKLDGCITCYLCFKSYISLGQLTNHLTDAHYSKERNEKHECIDCGKVFGNVNNLNRHRKNIHSNEKNFECHDCGEKFVSKKNLRSHIMFKHTKCFYCKKCHRKFIGVKDFKRHKKYNCCNIACDICGKEFYIMSALESHMVKHNGVLKYECDLCGKKFSWKTSITRHFKLVHGG